MFDISTLLLIGLAIAFLGVIAYCVKLRSQLTTSQSETDRLNSQYASIIDIDKAVESRQAEVREVEQTIQKLREDFAGKRTVYDSLLREISVYETRLEDISFGVYEPVYNYATSEEYKRNLERIRADIKSLIKADRAIYCPVEWTVGGSRTEGKKMMKQASKMMLRAFNGECDAAIARVSWNTMTAMQARIEKSFEAINKLNSVQQIQITKKYYDLKIAELRLEHELQQKIKLEKDEQRLILEIMREEEKAQREIEVAQRKAEDEESRYQKALAKATEEAQRATGEQLTKLDQKIQELQALLAAAQLQREKAISMAQLTKSGHVYVISNIGSFGEDVFKIGMTRRLEPMDRVRELGDASVPFSFDVHALVYSENAPDLEYKLHRKLADRRVNLISNRREFFRIDINELESVFAEAGHSLTLTKLAEAKEFRETLSIRESIARTGEGSEQRTHTAIPITLD